MDVESKLIIRVVLLIIEVFNCILHIAGLHLLFYVYRSEPKNTQKLCLINLAFSELLWNSVLVVRDIIKAFRLAGYNKDALNIAFWCINMFLSTGAKYVNISAMFYLTADRLMQILLHLRYGEYWNVGKTKIVLVVTWTFNLILGVTLLVYMYFNFDYVRKKSRLGKTFAVYVNTTLYFVFLIFSMITYLTMFCVYAKSEKRYTRKHRSGEKSLITIFIESRFFLSVILIGSYLLLTVLPSLMRAIWYLASYPTFTYHVTAYYLLSTRLSHTVDAVLYIFAQRSIRDVIFNRCRPQHCFRRKNVLGVNTDENVESALITEKTSKSEDMEITSL